jgi:hypothetical protein
MLMPPRILLSNFLKHKPFTRAGFWRLASAVSNRRTDSGEDTQETETQLEVSTGRASQRSQQDQIEDQFGRFEFSN